VCYSDSRHMRLLPRGGPPSPVNPLITDSINIGMDSTGHAARSPDPPTREKRPPMRRSRAAAIVRPTRSRGQMERERRRRNRAILQLWRDGWTGKRIAARLDITPAIVGNVTHK
jgi:hypothetical protein